MTVLPAGPDLALVRLPASFYMLDGLAHLLFLIFERLNRAHFQTEHPEGIIAYYYESGSSGARKLSERGRTHLRGFLDTQAGFRADPISLFRSRERSLRSPTLMNKWFILAVLTSLYMWAGIIEGVEILWRILGQRL